MRSRECYLVAGDPALALAIVEATNREAGVRVASLERIRGQALRQLGDLDGARTALDLSLAEARSSDAIYEIALTLDALVEIDVEVGDLTTAEQREAEATVLYERLGVRAGPGRRITATGERTSDLRTAAGSRT